MKSINIITVDNQHGLTRCSIILSEVLKNAGFQVSVFTVGKASIKHKIHRLTTYIDNFVSNTFRGKPPYDINIFIQDIVPSWLPYARFNCLLPMPEWFRDDGVSLLTNFDCILCCTKLTQEIFHKLGCKTEYISFTSLDQYEQKISKNYDKFFHLAGSNASQKGTKTLIEVWSRHPEWPSIIVRQKKQPFHICAPNIEYITNFLSDEILHQYQNTFGIHLCPSEVEGFGHYIVEGMSTKAVIITTNAPPMNELITSERGLLANYFQTKSQKLGTRYSVYPQALEEKIEEVLGMSYETKKQLGENARNWYLDNDTFFRQRLVEVLKNLD
ncbi:glycosyltransferase [Crocosphaera sp. UHCC 0190]|uniref:glycosyltransferase n=1 Tax=Crocosphaera sp. UHCC 0190 TaxID=3110246 RepID=UPI002B1FA2D2|nr:glycosyltransferase [Crocosphaera sp. UHCC 0190]MEA5510426.1 glycosyltransferase [Crocosphaera sp. UHCC 0190]